MQALWSRSVQSRSCRCGPCLHTAARVSRRTSTAVGRGRLRASDVFTASFSAMLASAAVLDARKKEKRASQWDQAIQEVRAGKDLASITTPDQVSIGKAADSTSNIMGKQIGRYSPDDNIVRKLESSASTVKQLLSTIPISMSEANTLSKKPSNPVWDELMALLSKSLEVSSDPERDILASQSEKVLSLDIQSATRKPEKSWYDDRLERASFYASVMPHREPQSQIHLDKLQSMVRTLISKLLATASILENTKAKARRRKTYPFTDPLNDTQLQTKLITERIHTLMDDSKLPTYRLLDLEGAHEVRKNLNSSIAAIFKSQDAKCSHEGELGLIVAKICYNLLVSTSAPSVTTYNIMIQNFTRRRYHEVAGVVVRSFNESRFRPNEHTFSEILRHYMATNDLPKLAGIIRQIDGESWGRGLKRRFVHALEKPAVHRWASTTKVMLIRNPKVLQEKLHLNSELFDSLIRASLRCQSLKSTFRYLAMAITEGCRIRTELFDVLVKRCMGREESKTFLLHLISTLSYQWSCGFDVPRGLQYDSHVRESISNVLEACGLGRTLSGAIDSFPSWMRRDYLDGMIRHIDYEEAKYSAILLFEKASLLETYLRQTLLRDVPSFVKMTWTPEQIDLNLTPSIPSWLESLGLSEYTSCLEHLTWPELAKLGHGGLADLGVLTAGARNTMLEYFNSTRGSKRPQLESPLAIIQKLKDGVLESLYQQLPKEQRQEYDVLTENSSMDERIEFLFSRCRALGDQDVLLEPVEQDEPVPSDIRAGEYSVISDAKPWIIEDKATDKPAVSHEGLATDDACEDAPWNYTTDHAVSSLQASTPIRMSVQLNASEMAMVTNSSSTVSTSA